MDSSKKTGGHDFRGRGKTTNACTTVEERPFSRLLLFSYKGGSTWAPPSGAQPIYVEDYTMAESPIYCTQYPSIY
jgi:hypothetical protein